MPFSEVVRLLSSSQQTGALNVKDAQSEVMVGQLFFQMGQLIDAVQGDHHGLDAVQELCQWIEADFAFEVSELSPRQTLVVYPTEKLIEKIKLRSDELKAVSDSMPAAEDIPVYQPGTDASALHMTPDELTLLLQCTGDKNVAQIALETHQMTEQLSRVLARLSQAGIISIEKSAAVAAQESVEEAASPEAKQEKKAVRYWRGHIVE